MNAWTLAAKDLRIFFRDRTGMLLGLGLPIVLATIFGVAMGAMSGGDGGMARVELQVQDEDASAASLELLELLRAAQGLRVELVGEEESARDQVAQGDAPAGLLIVAGYGERIARGEAPELTLFRDPAKNVEHEIVTASLVPVFFQAFGESIGQGLMTQGLEWLDFPVAQRPEAERVLGETWAALATLAQEQQGQEEVAQESNGTGEEPQAGFHFGAALGELAGLEIEDVVGEDSAMGAGAQAHAISGIAVMMLLFGLVACGSTLLEEREQGTLDRLRLVPRAGNTILGGKFLFTWLVGMLQLVVLFLYGRLLFDVPIFRSPLALTVASAATAGAATGFGILFAVLCRSRKQLEGLSTLVILAMSAAGGSWFPLFLLPEWFQTLGHFTLNAWAMDAFAGIFWYERGLLGILPEVGVLIGIGLGTSLLAVWLWNRRLAA